MYCVAATNNIDKRETENTVHIESNHKHNRMPVFIFDNGIYAATVIQHTVGFRLYAKIHTSIHMQRTQTLIKT